MVVGGRELIDTLWNVNTCFNLSMQPVTFELIDTLWNVNSMILYSCVTYYELIDTLWNVNELYAVDSETRFVN